MAIPGVPAGAGAGIYRDPDIPFVRITNDTGNDDSPAFRRVHAVSAIRAYPARGRRYTPGDGDYQVIPVKNPHQVVPERSMNP